MTPADVTYARNWQRAHRFTLELLVNGGSSARYRVHGTDPLLAALRPAADQFRWVNDTYTGQNLGCVPDYAVAPWRCQSRAGRIAWVSKAAISSQITGNISWARRNGIPAEASELATSDYTGLRFLPQQPADNPNLVSVLRPDGIRWIAMDASTEPAMRPVGAALGLPRHPIDVFYNVTTPAQEVSEYNWLYDSAADGGSGACSTVTPVSCLTPLRPATGWNSFIRPLQVTIMLGSVLQNDPRPFYLRQSNLTGGRLGYPVIDGALAGYRSVFSASAPVVSNPMSADGAALHAQQMWARALAAGSVRGYVQGGVVTITGPAGTSVPVTAPDGTRVSSAGGAAYGAGVRRPALGPHHPGRARPEAGAGIDAVPGRSRDGAGHGRRRAAAALHGGHQCRGQPGAAAWRGAGRGAAGCRRRRAGAGRTGRVSEPVMQIALTEEGTYPHHFGGVSVWCDQLIRGMPDYDFRLVALVATGSEPVRWKLPGNVTSLVTVPLWGPPPPGSGPRARLGRGRGAVPVGDLIDVLLEPPDQQQDRFASVLREMFGCGQAGTLSGALASESAVQVLSDAWRDRPESAHSVPTLHDAVTVMQMIEHALRPLSHPPVRADVVHAVTNGLGALPALTAKWQYGTPMLVTEHGIYMREQFLHSRSAPYRWPVRRLFLRFLRRLCALGYHEAQMITPGNVYNKRWEEQLGADLSKVRTVYNGVDPADFPALAGEPDVPTISWAGRVDPVKDLDTLLRAFALVREQIPAARLRIFGSPRPAARPTWSTCSCWPTSWASAPAPASRAGWTRSATRMRPGRSSCCAASPRDSPTP